MLQHAPIACSLGGAEISQRFADMAAVGRDSLIASDTEGGRHLLRFRSDADTRKHLESIVAAEARCCSFLDLKLAERDGEILLSLGAPPLGQPIADEIAAAFAAGGK